MQVSTQSTHELALLDTSVSECWHYGWSRSASNINGGYAVYSLCLPLLMMSRAVSVNVLGLSSSVQARVINSTFFRVAVAETPPNPPIPMEVLEVLMLSNKWPYYGRGYAPPSTRS